MKAGEHLTQSQVLDLIDLVEDMASKFAWKRDSTVGKVRRLLNGAIALLTNISVADEMRAALRYDEPSSLPISYEPQPDWQPLNSFYTVAKIKQAVHDQGDDFWEANGKEIAKYLLNQLDMH